MSVLTKSIALACAASILSFGVAVAQTDPAPAMAPAAPDAASGDTMMKKPMMKKHMMKKHKKKMMMKKM